MKKTRVTLAIMAMICLSSCGEPTPGRIYQLDTDEYKVHLEDVRSSYFNKPDQSIDLPSHGNVKGLVIPVEFRSNTCAMLTAHGGCEGIRNDLYKTLFGDGTGTNWESLASYYKKASYNKLNITGEISEWYTSPLTAAEFGNQYKDAASGGSVAMLDEAIAWYKSNHTKEELQAFDSNNDGYLDAVWLVYSVEEHFKNINDDLFWAFCFWNQGSTANIESPTPYSFMWASYNFMYENASTVDGQILPDAHTFIHETGHLMGLSDYYNYDDADHNKWGPAGGLDMMDFNIGDHNAYSKSLLEWVEPYVAEGNTTITLRPFESSGDCVIIAPEGYKGSIMDEYLILEYYTPTGLNEYDSINRYAGNYPLLFTDAGVKVYHVDSRLGGFRHGSESSKFAVYVDSIDTRFDFVNIVNENSPSRSGVADQKLIRLLESSGSNSFIEGRTATNATLFKEGSSFGYSTFKDYELQQEVSNGVKAKLGYKFKITSITAEGATIEIRKA